jgi:hypothetical protein
MRILKRFEKRMRRPVSRMFRVDQVASQRASEVQTLLLNQIAELSNEMNLRTTEVQRQIDRLRVDLYFAQLSSGRVFVPSKAVELKIPNSAIEMVLSGPAEDRSIIGAIAQASSARQAGLGHSV